MRRVRAGTRRALALLAIVPLAACDLVGGARSGAAEESEARSARTIPAGASCEASRDCGEEHACVDGICGPTRSSVAGELLASAAAAQLEGGDAAPASESYEAALRAYERAGVSPPPAVLCGSAEAALAAPRAEVPREVAARRADACFRGSLPGDPTRARVLAKLAEVRHEGLDVAAFDAAEPPAEFFTAPRRRPDPGAVRVHLELTGSSGPGSEEIDARLQSPAAVQAVVACFLEDYELHHQRTVETELPLRVGSRLRDMGTYDVYEARVTIDRSGLSARGFEPCVARALESIFAESFRMARTVSWETTAKVHASAR